MQDIEECIWINLCNLNRCRKIGKIQGAHITALSIFHFLSLYSILEIAISYASTHELFNDILGIAILGMAVWW